MNVNVFNARNANALAITRACTAALSLVMTLPENAVQIVNTITPGDQDVHSLYHREACATLLSEVCAHLGVPVPAIELVNVQAAIDAQRQPELTPQVEAPAEGEGDAEPA